MPMPVRSFLLNTNPNINMSLSLSFRFNHSNPPSLPLSPHPRFTFLKPKHPTAFSISFPRRRKPDHTSIPRSLNERFNHFPQQPTNIVEEPKPPRWVNLLSTAASLYPVYVTLGGVVACLKTSTFSWFVKRSPASYSFSLGLTMLAMGLTLELKDLFALFLQRPCSIKVSRA